MKTAWLILQILGAILAIWLILRIFIKQKLYTRWKSTMYIRIVGLVIVGCAGISLLLLYFLENNFSNEKRGNDAIRSSILNMDTSQVKSMVISYTNGISISNSVGSGFITKPIVIRDKANINNIATELRRISKYSPNHPVSEWKIFLLVNFKDNTKSWVEIFKNNDGNGCLIRIDKVTEFSVTNLGEYRNDNLCELIENIVSEENNKKKDTIR